MKNFNRKNIVSSNFSIKKKFFQVISIWVCMCVACDQVVMNIIIFLFPLNLWKNTEKLNQEWKIIRKSMKRISDDIFVVVIE